MKLRSAFVSRLFLAIAFLATLPLLADDTPLRQRLAFDDEWKFFLGDSSQAQDPAFADEAWRAVTLPHDWSIEGKFDAKAPMGGPGGFLPAGIGWYRKRIEAPAEWAGERVSVEFEGVYMNADVWLNGQHLATHPYGYTSFTVDLTSTLKAGTGNVLAVRVDNSRQKNSRWYSGSGIYRHVWLTVTGSAHVAPWGTFISVPQATAEAATVAVQTRIVNEGEAARSLKVQTVLLSPAGDEVGKMESDCTVPPGGSQEIAQQAAVAHPALWTPETPQLSRAVTHLVENGKEIDQVSTPFGIRTLAWNASQGLLLNGVPLKLNGGCIHGDNGVLGAAAFDRAEERKIELLKASGFNEVRTSHAPASPALLDACDRLGMLVMEDSFDCWDKGKNAFDYHVAFKDAWPGDIDAMILRDRNHPSIVFWNIGNEVPGIYDASGPEISRQLVARIHALDMTRPVTNAIWPWPRADQIDAATADWNALDIVGTNYGMGDHIKQRAQFPNYVIVSTESSPGNPINTWKDVAYHSYVVGGNVWSAMDYFGESGIGRWFYKDDPAETLNHPDPQNPDKVTPLGHGDDRLYPWHGALCGDLDILGNRKPVAHWRNIVWDKGEKLYMAVRQPDDEKKLMVVGWGWFPTWESWTWPEREGKPMRVEVYSRYPAVRLYLNDVLIGEKKTELVHDGLCEIFDLPYQPGTLKAVGVQDGHEVESCSLATAGDAAAIRLTPDRTTLRADGQDLSFIQVEVVDKDGKLQPNADGEVTFSLSGPAILAGLGNADMKCLDPLQGTRCHVSHGQAMVVLRSTRAAGPVLLEASSGGLKAVSLSLEARSTP